MMKKTGIILFFILISLFIGGVFSLENITINYPSSVNAFEEFNVNLSLIDFPPDIYDLKIDLLYNGTRIAKIWNGNSWQSTYNYLGDIINTTEKNSSSFLLNITEKINETADIEVKIRDSKSKIYSFSGYSIRVYDLPEQNNSNNNTNNQTQNNETNPTDNETQDNNDDEINIRLTWDNEDIVNGKEFEIECKVYNLEDKKYDLKIWIEFDDNKTVISDSYDDQNNKWNSGIYYIDELFDGPGDETESIQLRIRDPYNNFYGNARIFARLRGVDDLYEKNIEIIKNENSDKEEDTKFNKIEEKTNPSASMVPGEIVEYSTERNKIIQLSQKLNQEGEKSKTEDIKTNNSLLYESKSEKIKKYSLYAFAFLCMILCVLIGFRKLK
jgi:hypothetical protein